MGTKRKTENRLPKNTRFLAVDFFCGAGGTTRGLIDAGGHIIAGIDNERAYEKTFIENNRNLTLDGAYPRYLRRDIFPETDIYPKGEQNLILEELRQLIPEKRKKAPKVPLLFAICAPCQPFTVISKKEMTKKRKDGRNRDVGLLHEATKFVEEFDPELILAENVKGIGNPKYGNVWDAFVRDLEALGYSTGSKVVCASRFGVPQFRKRTILIAAKKHLVRPQRFAGLMQTSLLMPEFDPDASTVTVREAIGHFPEIKAGEAHPKIPNHRARALSELNLRRLSVAKPGQNNSYMENTPYGDLSLDCHRKANQKSRNRVFGDVYTRMRPDHPSPTITTKCHSISNGRYGHYDTKQTRGISMREAATLQSFPEDYRFYPDNQTEPVGRMIGNAVPPKLARYFSDYLFNTII